MMNESISLCVSMVKELDCLLSVFTVPSGRHFLALAAGWVLGRGRRTITAMLRAAGLSSGAHYSSYYRLFSKAAWKVALLWRAWATMLISMFYATGDIFCCGDDTLLKHRGPKIHGAGIFRDAVLSTHRMTVFHWGHNWVVLALVVRFPFWPDRCFALPIDARLRAKGEKTSTSVELMREMFHEVAGWFPGRKWVFCVDGSYSNLAGHLPPDCILIGRLRWDAALYRKPRPHDPHRPGRPRKKGSPLPGPGKVAAASGTAWKRLTVRTYGERRRVEVHSYIGVWAKVSYKLIRVVLVRDLAKPQDVQCFFCTDVARPLGWIIETYACRWSIERMFEDVKQFLGIEHPQTRTARSVLRVAPMGLILYGAVIVWYGKHRGSSQDYRKDPWYSSKKHASFRDMLVALRSASLREHISCMSTLPTKTQKIVRSLLQAAAEAA